MSEKLLPCPFCGGGAFVHRCEHAFHDAKIRCAGCQAEGPIFDVDDGEANEAGRNEAEAIAAWNRRTPAPEGEAVKSYGQKGRALYEAFWARNGDASPPPWDEQAHAIRAMWVNIARDAEPLYASPVVPKTADEIKAVVMAWLDADDPASWGDFEKRLNAAVSDEASPVVPVGVRERVLDELDKAWLHGQRRTSWRRDEAAAAIIAALRLTDTGRE